MRISFRLCRNVLCRNGGTGCSNWYENLIVALILCCGILCLAGCVTNPETPAVTTPQPTVLSTVVTIIPPPPVNVTIVNLTRYYRPEGGCTYGAQVEITNMATDQVTNLAIRFSLRDARSGSVREIKNLALERMDAS